MIAFTATDNQASIRFVTDLMCVRYLIDVLLSLHAIHAPPVFNAVHNARMLSVREDLSTAEMHKAQYAAVRAALTRNL